MENHIHSELTELRGFLRDKTIPIETLFTDNDIANKYFAWVFFGKIQNYIEEQQKVERETVCRYKLRYHIKEALSLYPFIDRSRYTLTDSYFEVIKLAFSKIHELKTEVRELHWKLAHAHNFYYEQLIPEDYEPIIDDEHHWLHAIDGISRQDLDTKGLYY